LIKRYEKFRNSQLTFEVGEEEETDTFYRSLDNHHMVIALDKLKVMERNLLIPNRSKESLEFEIDN
jgi:hypothetical protein